MRPYSLRIRLIVAYAGLIMFGFGGLALLAGQQISSAARRDYELRLTNEVILISRGMAEAFRDEQNPTEEKLLAVLDELKPRATSQLQLILVRSSEYSSSFERSERFRQGRPPDGWPLLDSLKMYPELVTASQGAVAVTQRNNRLFTAAPVISNSFFMGYVQLSEPASQLEQAVRERWEILGLGVVGIAAAALLASFWLSTSLIRPLEKLRDSAVRFSRGELSHRVNYRGKDEIGDVAHAFNQMAEQVQAMIEEQRAFASNTSHELRTPLTTMRLRTEALRHDGTLEPSMRQQYILELDEELIRLSELVDDLVLLSRFDAHRAEIGEAQLDLARFAHSLHRTMLEQAQNREITLSLDVALEHPVSIQASLNHVMILFRNLLDNAIKYTPPGGTITWRLTASGPYAIFTIEDTGQGIAPEQLPHVFERFFRADKARSRAVPGTGLGLALAKSIVEAYNAQIEITSPGLGQGTTVTVRWPVIPST